jgi:hypothetical protein
LGWWAQWSKYFRISQKQCHQGIAALREHLNHPLRDLSVRARDENIFHY